jgi:hypothetical protein
VTSRNFMRLPLKERRSAVLFRPAYRKFGHLAKTSEMWGTRRMLRE